MQIKKYKIFRQLIIKTKRSMCAVVIDDFEEITESKYNKILQEHFDSFKYSYRILVGNHEYLTKISKIGQESSKTENILKVEYLHEINL